MSRLLLRRSQAAAVAVAIALASGDASGQTTSPPAPRPPAPEVDTGYVVYGGAVSLPLGVGFRLPSYNRVDGVVLPWGPKITLRDGALEIDPTATYRSHIGVIDPYVVARFDFGQRNEVKIEGGRSTFTNDAWIRSDLVNSAAALFVGSDARNYFRADRVVGTFSRRFDASPFTVTPSVGALFENAWSTGSPVRHTSAPFSVLYRSDTLKLRRPNPPVAQGNTASGLGRVDVMYDRDETTFGLDGRIEVAFDGPEGLFRIATLSSGAAVQCCGPGDGYTDGFTQLTFGSKAGCRTFGTQRFDFRGHAVITPGDEAPPQRYAYLGGAGTLATVDLLALGGDNLMYVEGEYSIPLLRPILPFVGAPILSVRYAAGGAGIGDFPDLIQNIGVGIGVRLLKAEYHIDPNYRKTTFSKKNAFSIVVSLSL